MNPEAQLVLLSDPAKVAPLLRSRPTTIGRAADNRLRLASSEQVADHHAVVRFSLSQGWLVCDWQSTGGTYLEGDRVRQCRRLNDGDEIQLGHQGPVLVFRLLSGAGVPAAPGRATGPGAGVHPATASPPEPAPSPAGRSGVQAPAATAAATGSRRRNTLPGPAETRGAGAPLHVAGRTLPLDRIRSAHVRSRPRFPHSFSWWVLLCLGAMVLLPFPLLFWGVEIGALAAWILLGSRKDHELVVTLRDGMAHRHVFTNRITALSHRNGIRKAIGQSLEGG